MKILMATMPMMIRMNNDDKGHQNNDNNVDKDVV